MAQNKQEENASSFITQSEEYSLQNDVGRHTRNTELQSKGFREQLHEPQPSPYVHATDRMSAIDTDSAAIRTLGHGIDTAISLHEKYDEGPSIQEYLDDVNELKKAHDSGRITDEVYRREMRKARNAAENAYADNPKAMAKLKSFYGGGTFQDFALYEAGRLDMAKEYTARTGIECSPDDANFESVVVPQVQEWRNQMTEVALDMAKFKGATAKEGISSIEVRDTSVAIADKGVGWLSEAFNTKLASGNLSDNDLDNYALQIQSWLEAYDGATGRFGNDPIVKENRKRIAGLSNRILAAKGMTNEAQRKEAIQNAFLEARLEGTRLSNLNKAGNSSTNNLINTVKELQEKGQLSSEAGQKILNGINGDPNAHKELAKDAKKGVKGAGYGSIAIASLEPDWLTSAAVNGVSQNQVDEYYDNSTPEQKEELLFSTKASYNSWKRKMIETGREEFYLNGKNVPLNKQVRFAGFNSNGVKIEAVKGASPAAQRHAIVLSKGLTSYARLLACGNNKKCDLKAVAKDKAAISMFKKSISGLVDG